MISVVIEKELRENITNLRFSMGTTLTAVLTILCVVVLTNQYRQETADYQTRQVLQDEFLAKYAHTNRLGVVSQPDKPPEAFRPLIMGLPSSTSGWMEGLFEDPMPVLFPHIDLIFIVTVIMSLLAILFSYDAVTGERESGTLRLVLASTIKRPVYLLGKWIGGTLSLLIPFMISLLAGALYIALHPSIRWDTGAFVTFFLLLAASITFISSFYLLGLFVSTRTRNAAASILVCLFLWVLLILIIPNLSPYLAAQVYRIPSVTRHDRITGRMQSEERDDIGRQLEREVAEKYQRQYGELFRSYQGMNNDNRRTRIQNDPAFAAMVDAYRKETGEAWREANRIQREKVEKLSIEFNNKIALQNKVAKNIACLSPYTDFILVATDLTGTGLHGRSYFNTLRGRYTSEFRKYLGTKTAEAKEKDPMFDSNSYIDISDRPRFSFSEESLLDRLDAVMDYWGILVLFNVLFFVAAYVSFLRYDVR